MTDDGQEFSVSDTHWKVNWEVQRVLKKPEEEDEDDADGDEEEMLVGPALYGVANAPSPGASAVPVGVEEEEAIVSESSASPVDRTNPDPESHIFWV